jgi:LysR family nod box-dependent transcriptional activator
MKLRRHDLNLIPILETLLRRRNVTRASEELGLSQSATSHALMRLREQFGDALLVPRGRKMVLTGRAQALLEPVAAAVEALESLLEPREIFEQTVSTRRFKVGMADYVAALLLPPLVVRLAAEAPDVSLQVVPWIKEELAEKLRLHEVDLALLPRGSIDPAGLREELLFVDDLVVIAAADNPDVGETIDLEAYQTLPHVRFRQNTLTFADHQEARHPIRRKDALTVPDFLSLPFIVSGSRCIALTHRSMARQMRKFADLRVLEPPFETDQAHIVCYWSEVADVGTHWLKETIRDVWSTLETELAAAPANHG